MARPFAALLSTLFLAIATSANEHYLLPEQKSDLMHALKQKIERAAAVTAISRNLESQAVAASIEKALRKGARFDLVTTDLKSAAYFAKYANTRIKVPKSDDINQKFFLNILIIDDNDVCFSALAFNEAVLKSSIGEVICTTAEEDILFAKEIKKQFFTRFEAYNR